MAIARPGRGGDDRRTSNICGVIAECISVSNSNNQTFINKSTDSLFLFWGHNNIHNFRMTQGILLPIFTAYCSNKGRHGSSGKSQVLNKAEASLIYFHLCTFIIDRKNKKTFIFSKCKTNLMTVDSWHSPAQWAFWGSYFLFYISLIFLI